MNETVNQPGLLRRLWPRRSVLMRPADWVERVVLLAVITAALVLLPVSLAVASETYANQTAMGLEQSRTRHQTTATLVEDAPPVANGSRGEVISGVADVPARWTLPDGTERGGTVKANNGAKAGSPVPIWLDETGNPAKEPITREQAALSAVAIAMGMWITAAASLCGIFLLVRAGLNRSRSAAWQREWARVEPGWTQPTG